MTDVKFTCPSCKQPLEAAEDMCGQWIDCPSCEQPLEIPFKSRQAPLPIPAVPSRSERPEMSKACPFCGETILAAARKCKHCGEFLDRSQSRSPEVIPRGKVQCGHCHAIVTPQRMQAGCSSLFIAMLLLCLGILPGLIYMVWESSRKQCPNCKLALQ